MKRTIIDSKGNIITLRPLSKSVQSRKTDQGWELFEAGKYSVFVNGKQKEVFHCKEKALSFMEEQRKLHEQSLLQKLKTSFRRGS